MTTPESEQASAAPATTRQHKHGLAQYRRRRPFEYNELPNLLSKVPTSGVLDSVTGEPLGSVRQDNTALYRIEQGSVAAPNAKIESWNKRTLDAGGGVSRDEAADALWKAALPVRSRVWLTLRALVFTLDATLILVRIALVVLAIWFAFGFLMFLFDVRDLLHEIVRQWLEAVKARGT